MQNHTNENIEESRAKKLDATLKEWDAELQKIEAKAQKATADTKLDLKQATEKLREQWNAIHEKTLALRVASGAALDELTAHLKSAADEFKKGLEKARDQMNASD